jgi:hypothetical protein
MIRSVIKGSKTNKIQIGPSISVGMEKESNQIKMDLSQMPIVLEWVQHQSLGVMQNKLKS